MKEILPDFKCEKHSSEGRVGNEIVTQYLENPDGGQIQLQPNDDKFTVDWFGAQVILNSLNDNDS